MLVIEPSVSTIGPMWGEDPLLHIEKCGRICYKSEDKITDGSAEKFVSGIIKRGHESVLEHSVFVFKPGEETVRDIQDLESFLVRAQQPDRPEDYYRPYLRYTDNAVSGNVRAWRNFFRAISREFPFPGYFARFIHSNPQLFPEFQMIDGDGPQLIPVSPADLEPGIERLVHMSVTLRIVCDRGISHELVRHRTASFSQESTRYCNYGNERFGGGITVVEPFFAGQGSVAQKWYESCKNAESAYQYILGSGGRPEGARSVLPTSAKTELAMTDNLMGWLHFLSLREDPAAHPDARRVAGLVREALAAELEEFREKE